MQRNLKVKGTSGYHYRKTPTIQIKGLYLNSFGFTIDTPLQIDISNRKITITPANKDVSKS